MHIDMNFTLVKC